MNITASTTWGIRCTTQAIRSDPFALGCSRTVIAATRLKMSHATHVLIRGHVFTYADKAPFALSGKSLLGALEYDEASDQTKCHECGEWAKGLGSHVSRKHGLLKGDYNREHGLTPGTALCSKSTSEKHRARAKKHYSNSIGLQSTKDKVKAATHARAGKPQEPRSDEHRNERNRCRAQQIFRLQVLAVELGHTPTHEDIRHAEAISLKSIEDMFGGTTEAIKSAGLYPNTNNRLRPLPRNFPTLEELAARKALWDMPWDDYAKAAGKAPVDPIMSSNTPLSQF